MSPDVAYAVIAALVIVYVVPFVADDRAAGRKHAKEMEALKAPKAPRAPKAGAE